MNNKNKHLFYLHELSDYKISSKDPDVRGWNVKDSDNRVIGKVDNLLVNKNAEKVVYLDVEVDQTIIEADHDPYGQPANADVHEFINHDGENHIIIPIGLTNLNEDQKFVYTDSINHQTFAETKRIEKGANIDREYEKVVLESYSRDNKNGRDARDRRSGEDNYRGEGDRRRDADEIYENRKNDPDYRDQETRYTNSTPDEEFDADYERRRQRREAGPEYRGDSEALDADAGRKGSKYDPEEPYNKKEDERRPTKGRTAGDEKSGRIPDDDSFYKRKEFDSKNYRGRKEP